MVKFLGQLKKIGTCNHYTDELEKLLDLASKCMRVIDFQPQGIGYKVRDLGLRNNFLRGNERVYEIELHCGHSFRYSKVDRYLKLIAIAC